MSDWVEATLILRPDVGGHRGQIIVGNDVIDVIHWHKSAGGVVKFRVRHDAEWAAFLARLSATVTG